MAPDAPVVRFDDVRHVILLPNYKEGMDTLCETLDVLASHSRAATAYHVCLAMEASERDSDVKARTLQRMYTDHFLRVDFALHPRGLDDEIGGKGSNVAWAARCMAALYPETDANDDADASPLASSSSSNPSSSSTNTPHVVVTVIDADTAFAEDYFAAVTYHYVVASAERRARMLFAPCTVFDRNASAVPPFVRTTDMLWSIGVLGNLYDSSPIKFPCSAYSATLALVRAVGGWDGGAEALGEDMHMMLKCFFATRGRVDVTSVYSPASQCNVEGEPGSGWAGALAARYTQATRHIWGSLDTGYALRRTLEVFVDDAHLFLGHWYMAMVALALLMPADPLHPSAIQRVLFPLVYGTHAHLHPTLALAVRFCTMLQGVATVPYLFIAVFYERYYAWVSRDRWALQTQANPADAQTRRVSRLGRRPALTAVRSRRHWFDWALAPVVGLAFVAIPQCIVQWKHLWTDRLTYAVAAKPTLAPRAPRAVTAGAAVTVPSAPFSALHAPHASLPLPATAPSLAAAAANGIPALAVHAHAQAHRTSARAAVDDDSKSIISISSRGDSGYYDWETDASAAASGALLFKSPPPPTMHSSPVSAKGSPAAGFAARPHGMPMPAAPLVSDAW
ncbi:hypothetical protein CXG81DRAFT_12802 [Caulochytrium protostelioides]|uniref:Glycosyltransferase 2-like domain-containing protein n=1 Tax=Caulochytrium protostelioides TaxID=1555241 RepID=A0A4P9X6H8_9FUNG|nr:hypothetical protein CXG81DRAFT_12802 [Caulochytrium protostelioides]|eukprot:RKP00797.1 hypothetical protein CXG81DRAFT_12802 [Caulochytrium protostelioides]